MLSASCTSIVPAVCSVGLVRWCEQVAVQSDALDILLRYIFEARPVETASASLQIVSLFVKVEVIANHGCQDMKNQYLRYSICISPNVAHPSLAGTFVTWQVVQYHTATVCYPF